MSEETCETCRFYRTPGDDYEYGSCHRFPPQMAFAPRYPGDTKNRDIVDEVRPQDGGWPLTFPDDWCGEFSRRNGDSPCPAPDTNKTKK